MKLKTERLELIPLNAYQLKLLTEDIIQFEKEIQCQYCGEEIEGGILKIFRGQIEVIKTNHGDYLWHTFWLFKLRNTDKFIGSASFKNIPSDRGEVEIGYGINKKFENYGYTTEAVNAMCEWALKQPGVKKIVAETEKGNIKSQRVLEKCKMIQFKETEDCYWWELTKESIMIS